MQAIYEACREMLFQHRKGEHQELSAHPELLVSLHEFERRNRGHRFSLDSLAKQTLTPQPWQTRQTQDGTRRDTILASTRALLEALAALAPEQLPTGEAFQKFWTANDWAGLLVERMQSLAAMRFSWRLGWAQVVEFKQTHDGKTWSLYLKARHSTRPLTARRELHLPVDAGATLQACCAQLQTATQAIDELFSTAQAWPEFSAQAISEFIRESAKTALNKALKDYSAEDRAELAAAWASLQPECLRRFAKSTPAAADY